jgi:hypothetical protein
MAAMVRCRDTLAPNTVDVETRRTSLRGHRTVEQAGTQEGTGQTRSAAQEHGGPAGQLARSCLIAIDRRARHRVRRRARRLLGVRMPPASYYPTEPRSRCGMRGGRRGSDPARRRLARALARSPARASLRPAARVLLACWLVGLLFQRSLGELSSVDSAKKREGKKILKKKHDK